MSLHPAAPEDLAGLVAAYQQTTQAVIDLGRSCSDADFDLPTACPGWTVKDQISHVVGLESWLHTGDVGELDAEGRLFIKGRKKELIVTPEGLNVFPDDVERALDAQPGVTESAVVASPGDGHERVHAVLVHLRSD